MAKKTYILTNQEYDLLREFLYDLIWFTRSARDSRRNRKLLSDAFITLSVASGHLVSLDPFKRKQFLNSEFFKKQTASLKHEMEAVVRADD